MVYRRSVSSFVFAFTHKQQSVKKKGLEKCSDIYHTSFYDRTTIGPRANLKQGCQPNTDHRASIS